MHDFHMQCATHAGILTSLTSTRPHGRASQASGTLSYPSYRIFSSPPLFATHCSLVLSLQTSPKAALKRMLSSKRSSVEVIVKMVRSHSFGAELDPRWIVGALTHSTSELLRTL